MLSAARGFRVHHAPQTQTLECPCEAPSLGRRFAQLSHSCAGVCLHLFELFLFLPWGKLVCVRLRAPEIQKLQNELGNLNRISSEVASMTDKSRE
jgi:hypothetical protein